MTEKKGASSSRVSGRRFQSSPSRTTASAPRRSRAQNRRSSSTSQSRAARARQRGLEKNRSEAKAAERKRAFSSGTFVLNSASQNTFSMALNDYKSKPSVV